MPTYEYVCRECGTHVEVYQSFSDPPLTVCGVCDGPLRKVFHPAGILFKGSGFYATDSRRAAASKDRSERAGAGTSSSSSDGSGSGSSSSSSDGSGSGSSSSSKPSEGSSASESSSAKERPA